MDGSGTSSPSPSPSADMWTIGTSGGRPSSRRLPGRMGNALAMARGRPGLVRFSPPPSPRVSQWLLGRSNATAGNNGVQLLAVVVTRGGGTDMGEGDAVFSARVLECAKGWLEHWPPECLRAVLGDAAPPSRSHAGAEADDAMSMSTPPSRTRSSSRLDARLPRSSRWSGSWPSDVRDATARRPRSWSCAARREGTCSGHSSRA